MAYPEPLGYDVEQASLPDTPLHLDGALSIPKRPGIIVCPEAFPDGIPSRFHDWKQITVPMVMLADLQQTGFLLMKLITSLGIMSIFPEL